MTPCLTFPCFLVEARESRVGAGTADQAGCKREAAPREGPKSLVSEQKQAIGESAERLLHQSANAGCSRSGARREAASILLLQPW
jgi:hypothetical protein